MIAWLRAWRRGLSLDHGTVLGLIPDGGITGWELRRRLRGAGYFKSAAAFYYMMAQIEGAGGVRRETVEVTCYGHPLSLSKFYLKS